MKSTHFIATNAALRIVGAQVLREMMGKSRSKARFYPRIGVDTGETVWMEKADKTVEDCPGLDNEKRGVETSKETCSNKADDQNKGKSCTCKADAEPPVLAIRNVGTGVHKRWA